jgi:phage repressor protein C with HTH and peptisase S24 domain
MKWFEKIRARREQLSISQAELGVRVGLSQAAIDKIESGRVQRTRAAARLATALNIPLSEIDPDLAAISSERFPEPNAGSPIPVQISSHRRVPVYGQAIGGDDGRFIMNGTRLMDVFCPPSLEGVRDAYAVIFHGSSMEPRFFEGEAGWVNPHLPVKSGDFVVAQIAADNPGDPPFGYVKQFVSKGGTDLVLRQINPPEGNDEILRFPVKRVISVHKIVLSGQI